MNVYVCICKCKDINDGEMYLVAANSIFEALDTLREDSVREDSIREVYMLSSAIVQVNEPQILNSFDFD